MATLAEGTGNALDFLRGELSQLVAEEEASATISVALEPWLEPVDLNILLGETLALIRRYVVIHDEAAAIGVVMWIALAWVHHIAVHSPILRIVSGDADAGKTTLCGVFRFLTPRAYAAAEMTGASLYRFVDQAYPTLIIDDADNLFARKPDLVHIVNVSWTHDSAKIPRVDKHGNTYWFDTFCPKIIAGIGLALKPATRTRCIDIRMWPKLPNEKVQDFNHVDDEHSVELRRKWMRWAADNAAALKDAAPAMGDFNNRIRMNWKVQFAIADLTGGKWPKAVRKAAIQISRERQREPSEGKRFLAAFWDLFAAYGPKLASAGAQKLLAADPNSEWADYHGHGPITVRQIALILDAYDVHPEVIHPYGRKAERGYRVEQFEKPFRHYLGKPLPPNCTTVHTTRGKRRE